MRQYLQQYWLLVMLLYYVLVAIVLVNVILSWLPGSQWSRTGRFLLKITEPLLKPFRRLLPPFDFPTFSIDFSPTIPMVILAITYYLLRRNVCGF